jgi:hypothetical protein
MTISSELIAVLKSEVELGETLLHNLAAQKEAILAWNSSALLLHVEQKEHLVGLLTKMETQRQEIVRKLLLSYGISTGDDPPSLKMLLARLPSMPQTAALAHLQQRTWQIYSQLRANEKYLAGLMGVLLNHIDEALGSLIPPPQMFVYGEKGSLAVVRPEPGIVREKV